MEIYKDKVSGIYMWWVVQREVGSH